MKTGLYKACLIQTILLLVTATNSISQEQCDFDEDQRSDFLSLSSSNTSLVWNAVLSSDNTIQSTTFGLTTDLAVPANWENETITSLGIIRIGKKNELIWKLYLSSGLLEEQVFGKSGQVVMSGADFDGNGISDAAIVQKSKGALKWIVKLNMFYGADQRTVSFRHGVVGDRVFYLSPEGTGDWAGVFGKDKKGRAVMTLRNIITKEKITVKGINKKFAGGLRPRPFPVKSEDGTDVIGFFTPDGSGVDTVLTLYDLDGQILDKVSFDGLGVFSVGNYDGDTEGEEIVFQTTANNIIYNPFAASGEKQSNINGQLVDQLIIENLDAPTPVPTATPQASATATPG